MEGFSGSINQRMEVSGMENIGKVLIETVRDVILQIFIVANPISSYSVKLLIK